MGILSANFKHLYQTWPFRLFWLMLVMVSAVPVSALAGRSGPELFPALVLAFVLGVVLGSYQQHVRSNPFTFLLPRHQWVVPRQALVHAAVFGGLVGVACLALAPLGAPRRIVFAAVGFLLSMALCMGGSALAVAVPRTAAFVGFLPVLIIGGSITSVPDAINELILARPLPFLLLGAGLIAWTWRILGQRSLARQAVISPSLFLFDAFNIDKAREFQRRRRASTRAMSREPGRNPCADLFLEGIRRCAPGGLGRCACDVGHRLLGFITPRIALSVLPSVILLAIWTAYTGGGVMIYSIISLIVVAGLSGNGRVPLPLGRRQRLAVESLRLLALCVFVGLAAWLITITTNSLLPMLPPIEFGGRARPPHALPVSGPAVSIVLLPLAYALAVWLGKRRAWLFLCWVPFFALGALLSAPKPVVTAEQLVFFAPLSLALALGMMSYHFLRRDLPF